MDSTLKIDNWKESLVFPSKVSISNLVKLITPENYIIWVKLLMLMGQDSVMSVTKPDGSGEIFKNKSSPLFVGIVEDSPSIYKIQKGEFVLFSYEHINDIQCIG